MTHHNGEARCVQTPKTKFDQSVHPSFLRHRSQFAPGLFKRDKTVDWDKATHSGRLPGEQALERDVFEVLRLVRSAKNLLAPISRIPPDVFSLIPDYYGEHHAEQDVIVVDIRAITGGICSHHIPRYWTRLDSVNVDKTRTYIQRSRSSPLQVYLSYYADIGDTFPLIIPHIPPVKSLNHGLGPLNCPPTFPL